VVSTWGLKSVNVDTILSKEEVRCRNIDDSFASMYAVCNCCNAVWLMIQSADLIVMQYGSCKDCLVTGAVTWLN